MNIKAALLAYRDKEVDEFEQGVNDKNQKEHECFPERYCIQTFASAFQGISASVDRPRKQEEHA